MLSFRTFRHKVTGQVLRIPAGRYGNFQNAIKKIVNYVHYNYRKFYIVHLTLTVAENTSDLDYKNLHRVDTFIKQRLKRAGAECKNIAVKERQERGAVHYHVLYIYNRPYVFPSVQEIEKSWGLGFVKISAPKIRMRLRKIINYIGKYIGKGYEFEALNFKKSFSASQIKQIYKLTPQRLAHVMTQFGKERAEELRCTYRKVFEIVTMAPFRPFKSVIIEFPSEWVYEGICDEPF
ncbi:MAG: hypothetical protein ACLQF0_12530 [Dissulfurispiraceae bacterium]